METRPPFTLIRFPRRPRRQRRRPARSEAACQLALREKYQPSSAPVIHDIITDAYAYMVQRYPQIAQEEA